MCRMCNSPYKDKPNNAVCIMRSILERRSDLQMKHFK